jgi:hypothetical protein
MMGMLLEGASISKREMCSLTRNVGLQEPGRAFVANQAACSNDDVDDFSKGLVGSAISDQSIKVLHIAR